MISFEQLHHREEPLLLGNVWNIEIYGELEKASQKVTNGRNFSPLFI
ncbi:hypothetical protein SAMN06265171_101236 [Chryseobacterium rhizoplanae]|uniref:Uncharacterized protein n=1 Tax=Chryseobacterium rhizoplanae TaxID=1609531 RepID=A0A521AKZ4_9FLAO|nr:hypothetical protein SAMN06265171_101236 [Chryseobacterium rhizoplanae]